MFCAEEKRMRGKLKVSLSLLFLLTGWFVIPEIPVYAEELSVVLSEVMVKNHSAVMTEEGVFPDWIEIRNGSNETVNLDGWSLSDGKNRWVFPDMELQGDSYLKIEAGEGAGLATGFSLSDKEQLFLRDPDGNLISVVEDLRMESDHSLALQEDGHYQVTTWPTPGYANTQDGYRAYCDMLPPPVAGLMINEACNANTGYQPFYDIGTCDWIELKNNSEKEVNLSSYYLSDKNSNKKKWRLPDRILTPGEILVVYCGEEQNNGFVFAPFSLGVPGEGLWLTDEDGHVQDAMYLHDVPVNGSCGRMDGEGGFFYFEESTPGRENIGGFRLVTSQPEPSLKPMTYDSVEKLTVELSCEEGTTIYYTTDGTLPTVSGARIYSGPIEMEKNTIIRAFAVQDGACASPVRTMSYILNGNHTLPVLSLVVNSFPAFQGIYFNQQKDYEIPGVLTLFENGEEKFSNACGVQMKGWTSLHLPKKSLGVYFRGKYGDGEVHQDLFGNGVSEYSSLSIRAGQDYTFTVVRNELFQKLCAECFDDVLTQNGKYCALYVNGTYWGLYCLKENVNEQYFASLKGVDADTVLTGKGQIDYGIGLREAIEFSYRNDLSEEENYDKFCSMFNIDSLIGWIIMEGYSGNSDTVNNIRYFSSPEYDNGRWQLCYYDLDWGFTYFDFAFSNVIGGAGNPGYQMTEMIKGLLRNERFRERFLTIFAELIKTNLSNENVLAEFDELIWIVEDEVPKDRERWEMSETGFRHRIEEFRNFVMENDYDQFCIEKVCTLLNVTPEERTLYFGE